MTTKPPILNIADVDCVPMEQLMPKRPPEHILQKFSGRMGQIAPKLGAQKLGYNLTIVAPGKRAFPLHNHRVNEEMFFILEGQGELRLGEQRYPVKSGDVIACPPGGPETAHQLINTSERELKYLAVSTRLHPEVCEYPDSGKFAIRAEYPPAADGKPQGFVFVGRGEQNLDYWDGE
ncbi:MAG: cupin domain-containing protein [Nevskia sp.]|nr:cupin domain-containing protein [Nevskia sp.]